MGRGLGVLVWLVAAGAVPLLLSGCDVAFTEPVPGESGAYVDPEPYLGLWSSGDLGPSTLVSVAPLEGGLLRAELLAMEGATATGAFTVSLTRESEQVIAWFSPDPDTMEGFGIYETPWGDRAVWMAAALSLDGGGDELDLRPMDTEAVRAALEAGRLSSELVVDLPDEYRGYLLLLDPSASDTSPDLSFDDLFLPADSGARFVRYDSAQATRQFAERQARARPTHVPVAPAYPRAGYPQPYFHPTAAIPTPIPTATAEAGATLEPERPVPIDRLLVGLVIALVAGAAAAFGVDYVRRRDRVRASAAGYEAAPAGSDRQEGQAWTPYIGPALVILAVVGGPILYLAILLRGLSVPLWAEGEPGGAAMLLHDFAPYALVVSFGAVIGIAEVIGAYPGFAAAALRTRWAAMLVLFNAGGTLLAYSVAVAYSSGPDHPLLRTLAVAVGFALVIRTRFVIARELDDPTGRKGIQVDFGWPYARLQELARQGMTRELLHNRRFAVHAILRQRRDWDGLARLADEAIRLSGSDQAARLDAELREIAATSGSDAVARARAAALVVDATDHEDLLFLLEHLNPEAPGGR